MNTNIKYYRAGFLSYALSLPSPSMDSIRIAIWSSVIGIYALSALSLGSIRRRLALLKVGSRILSRF